MLTIKAILTLSIASVLLVLALKNERVQISISLSKESYNYEKRNTLKGLVIISLFVLIGIMAKDSYDLYFYRVIYETRGSHGKEPLFDVIQYLFYDAGLSFQVFKAVWITVIGFLIYRAIRSFSDVPSFVLALSFFSVLPNFITQFRSSMVCAIILNAFILLRSNRPVDRLYYFIIVILCSMIHVISLLYLVFLFARPIERLDRRIVLLVLFSFLFIFLIANTEILSLIESSIPVLLSITSRLGMAPLFSDLSFAYSLFIVFERLFLFFMTEIACNWSFGKYSSSINEISINRQINLLSLIFLPFCFSNASFLRLYHPIVLFQYSVISNVGEELVPVSRDVCLGLKMRNCIIIVTLLLFAVSLYENPADFIRMYNSI